MPVPGYDPEDLDDWLSDQLSRGDLEEYLTADELRRYDEGEGLVDLLDDEDIDDLLDEHGAPGNE